MTDRDMNERLDGIALALPRRPSLLNAVHACRPNHPLGRGDAYKWRNLLWAIAQADATSVGRGVAERDRRWAKAQADAEAAQ